MVGFEEHISEPEKPLFHYTSIQGLIGIFAEGNVWATSIYHLNDKEELFHARKMFLERMTALLQKTGPGPFHTFAIRPVDYEEDPQSAFLSAIRALLNFVEEFPVFVCSFTEEGDQLSQWRGYCPNALGFSIGFNNAQLKERIDQQKFILRKCLYEKDQQNHVIDQCIKTNIASVLPTLTRGADNTKLMSDIFINILKILPTIKNEHYKEEREWRLIASGFHLPKNKMKFRPGKTAIIPYYEFGLMDERKKLPIESIRIGPTPNREESFKSVYAILDKQNMSKNTKILHSKIAYREI